MTSELSNPPSSIENLSVPGGPTKTVIRLLKSNAIGVVALLLVIAVTLGNPAFLSFFNIATCCRNGPPRGSWRSA